MPVADRTLRAAAASQGFPSLSSMCKAAGVGRRTVRHWLRTGEIPFESKMRLGAVLKVPAYILDIIGKSVVPVADVAADASESNEP